MRVIVVGAGGTGRELVRRLGPTWDVVLVDTDADRLRAASALRESVQVEGDGSSAVVLRRAGLDEASAVVAATPDDDANLETIRIALKAGVPSVIGVAGDPVRVDEYRALEVPVFSPNRLAAREVELELEPRRVASSAFASGKAEAIEVHIAPDASVAGKQLKDLHSQTWVVAAVLRGGEMIVPHGDTTLLVGDRVTVVGAAADYASIVETFTAGVSTFPLGFGRKVVVGYEGEDDEPAVRQAAALVRASRADALIVVTRRTEEEGGGPPPELADGLLTEIEGEVEFEIRPAADAVQAAVTEIVETESVGVVVVAAGEQAKGRFRTTRLLNAHASTDPVPLLLARSAVPWSDILVPARRTPAGDAAARAAIDLSYSSGAGLTGVAAVAPAFVATRTETVERANAAIAWLRAEGAVHGVDVESRVEQGNPVRVLVGAASPSTLIVMGGPELPVGAFNPGISVHVAARAPGSVLLIPTPA